MSRNIVRILTMTLLVLVVAGGAFFGGYATHKITNKPADDPTVQEQISELEQTIDVLNASIQNLNNDKSSLQNQINSLTSQKLLLTNQVSSLQAQVEEKNALIETKDAEIQQLQAEKTANTNIINELNAEVATLTAEKEELESGIQSLNAQITELNSDIEELNSEIDNLESRISQKDTQIQTMQNTITGLNESIATKDGQIQSLQMQVANLQGQVSTLTSQKQELESQVLSLNTDVALKQTTINNLNEEITNLEAEIQQKNTTIDELQIRIEQLENFNETEELMLLRAQVADLEAQVNTLNEDKESLETQVTTLTGDVAEKQTTIDALNAEIVELEADIQEKAATITELTATVEELEESVNVLNQEKQTLSTQVTTLTSEKQVLEQQVATLTASVETLTADKNGLLTQVNDLTAQLTVKDQTIATLNGQITTLQGNIEALNDTIAILESENGELESEITSLETQIAEKDSQIAGLNTQISSLTNQINTLTSQISSLESEIQSLQAQIEEYKEQLINVNTLSVKYLNIQDGSIKGFSELGLEKYNEGKITHLNLPGSYSIDQETGIVIDGQDLTITDIAASAFKDKTNLVSVTIPEGLTYLGSSAFDGTTGLLEIKYNAIELTTNNLMFFGSYFGDAGIDKGGITVTIDNKVKIIPNYIFTSAVMAVNNGPKIYEVKFEENSVCTTIGNYAFYNNPKVQIVTIPESVTSIGSYAFYYSYGLQKLNYNATNVTSVGTDVFYDAGKNTDGVEVNIGANVTNIPSGLFVATDYYGVHGIKVSSVVFEDGSKCESIADGAFRRCIGLKTISIPNSVTSIGNGAFQYCTSLYSVTLPDSVVSIGAHTFDNCTALSTITIPSSVTSIGQSAFSYSDLRTVTIPNSVISVGASAFSNITYLRSVTIPSSLVSIGESAFDACSSLSKVYYLGNQTNWSMLSDNIGVNNSLLSDASRYYINFESVDEVEVIDNNGVIIPVGSDTYTVEYSSDFTGVEATLTFRNDGGYVVKTKLVYDPSLFVFSDGVVTGLSEKGQQTSLIVIPPTYSVVEGECVVGSEITVTTIQQSAFAYNGTFIKVILPNTLTTIGESAFEQCALLESITISENVKTVGKYAFSDCVKLSRINFNAKNMDDLPAKSSIFSSFSKSTAKRVLNVGSMVTHIPACMFYVFYDEEGASYLTEVNFKEGSVCQSIGDHSFVGSTNLSSIVLPNSVTTIGSSAFDGCTGLINITLPNRVSSIGDYAFDECTSLENVYYLGSSAEWDVFSNNIGSYNTSLTDANRYYITFGDDIVSVLRKDGLILSIDDYSVDYITSKGIRVAKVTFSNNNYEVIVTKEL